jgi:hypothetical protein
MAQFLEKADVLAIPDDLCPMIVLSDNIRSIIAWGIKTHEAGNYNHLMWLLPGHKIASQNAIFQAQKVSDYFKRFRLKFWYCPEWSAQEKEFIIANINHDLGKSWYKKLYDPLAIFGQLIHCDWIQTPGLDICSDKGSYLKLIDPEYTLNHPDPEEVNGWLKQHAKYKVYGRYVPD